ncbi:uncharacterized protein LOC106165652 [Lingula anatina]|uniref:Uncharacterized protein LOC106165652 n=1 Tax=Lingula anatina TaxID=7574 RepID=A0A1S3IPD8_LINAN|nr:uncharacterized protein LOC106165652 [Lingula anatina]|eukprot:XP_013399409.1 uncharacterized protein LOC106165652 [Lingula anatina]
MKKAKKFVSLLVNRLSKENFDESEWNKVFQQAVHDLPDGALKTTLETHLEKYLTLFKKKLFDVHPDQSVAGEKSQEKGIYNEPIENLYAYNLYLQKGQALSEESISTLDPHEKRSLYLNYLAKKFDDEDETQLFRLVSEAGKPIASAEGEDRFPWLGNFRKLCLVTLNRSSSNPQTLQKLMHICLTKLGISVAECIANRKHRGGKSLRREILNLLVFFHFKNKDLNQCFDKPSYADLMASLLSLYVDLNLVLNRKVEEDFELGEHVAFVVHFLLRNSPVHYLDVILQLEAVEEMDKDVILPLFRKILSSPPAKETCAWYSKYMVAVRFAMRSLGEVNIQEILRVAQSIPAPPDFMDWLRQNHAVAVDSLPETKKFKGIHISRFLLNPAEADEELLEKLLDIMTEQHVTEKENNSSVDGENSTLHKDDQGATADQELTFFVDTTADKKTAAEMQREFQTLNEETEGLDKDESDLEVMEVDINSVILNMDSESEEDVVLLSRNGSEFGEEEDVESLTTKETVKDVIDAGLETVPDSSSDIEHTATRHVASLPDLSQHLKKIEHLQEREESPEIEIQAEIKRNPEKALELSPSPIKRRLRPHSAMKGTRKSERPKREMTKALVSMSGVEGASGLQVYDFTSDVELSPAKLRKTDTSSITRSLPDSKNEVSKLDRESISKSVTAVRTLRSRTISECSAASSKADNMDITILDYRKDLPKRHSKRTRTPVKLKEKPNDEVSKMKGSNDVIPVMEQVDKSDTGQPREETSEGHRRKSGIPPASRRNSAKYALRSSRVDGTE